MPHPSQITLALLANVSYENEGQGVTNPDRPEQGRYRQHCGHAGAIVGNPGPVNACALLPNVQRSIGREDCIDVGAERDVAAPEPWVYAKDVADVIDSDVIETDFTEPF